MQQKKLTYTRTENEEVRLTNWCTRNKYGQVMNKA